MSESAHFQFYGTFKENIKMLPKEEQLDFYDKLTDYGLYGTEPEFGNPYLAIIFNQMKFAIDNQKTKSGANAENGKRGGRKSELSESNARQIMRMRNKGTSVKEISEAFDCSERTVYRMLQDCQNQDGFDKTDKTDKTEIAEMNRNEFELEHEHEIPPEADSACEDSEEAIADGSPPDDYARRVFDLCAKVGIPNCNGNFINFIQRDFKLALSGVRELRLHSDEFLSALENYGKILQLRREGRTWWEREMRLDQLCGGQKKLIMRFLPENFKVEDYLKEVSPEEEKRRRQEEEKAESERRLAEKYGDAPKKCPKCRRPIYPNGDMVACMQCHVWYEKTDGGWELHGHSP
ncbi:MAG: helix-turn-helix domain-containing protein [Lachnospiraceae bacterium]|nr:helix-turn-helix domain-containing protein [Lachnospiraceae bacterium]